MLNETQYEITYTKCIGAAIDTIWQMLNPSHNSWTEFEGLGFEDFIKCRESFLWVLERLLKEGSIKLHRNGIFLESSIKDQISLFRKVWPASIKASGYEDFYWWFLIPSAPPALPGDRKMGITK